MGGDGGDDVFGGGEDGEEAADGDLKARVRQQLAAMMNKRKANAGGGLEDDESF